ncbi:MAG: trypsin-like serine protease [Myxococcales bacterium]|nr:trypsin-like serine protease [Myxococcales bacterium]
MLEWNGGSCLGVLVSATEVVTAGHCAVGRAAETFRTRFPAVANHPPEERESRVIEAEFDLAAGKDFARLRLATPTEREPFRVRTDALADGATVTHWRRRSVGQVEELYAESCEVVVGSFVLSRADSPDSPRMTLGGCGVRPGDSGGPVTLDGELVALNQAWVCDAKEPPRGLGLGYEGGWRAQPPVITAVNLRCAVGRLCRWPGVAEAREAWLRDARTRLLAEETAILDALASFTDAHPELYVRVVRRPRGGIEQIRLGPVCSDGVARRVALPAHQLVRTVDAFGRLVVARRTLPSIVRRFPVC